MESLFLQVLNMSIMASYVILIVIVARLLLKKAPKTFSYALWSVVLFRLICPFSFESVFSLIPINSQTVPHNIGYSQAPQIHSAVPVIDQAVNSSLPQPVVGASVNPMQIWIALGEAVWLFGIAILLLYSIFTAIRLYRKLKPSKHIYDNIYETNGIQTPFVFGIIKPKIYLPLGLSENEKTYIIKHEQMHLKRFDHIIKPFAFLVLCCHWFNPLVWVAFFFMGEDMELSCDESVIRQMGSGIKKDYSTSLLSLSTGRRFVGGSPLAFGEINTKGRIMNILNYKQPAFWGVIVLLIACVAIGLALISNPLKERLTVEDYANQFIQQQIEDLESANATNVKIIDSKIIKLEKIASFDNMLTYPVELWRLEYRLKPEDMSKVMLAGGMKEIDGWITEDASPGKPILIFSYKGSDPDYLGIAWDGESDFRTLAGQATALRIFLEGKDLLPHETYSGNHTIVKFPLSTGETCQLFLSQPVEQGKHGIWCAERWMDGNGYVYHITPYTDGTISDYYKDLQNEVDNGHQPGLLDPLQVAIAWINNDLRQPTTLNELSPQYSATVEDFMRTPKLEAAVKSAFVDSNKNGYKIGECFGEGHIILGHDKKSSHITVYALTMYGEYGFEDDNFVKISGSGVIPAVFTFTESKEGLIYQKIEYPEDGSMYMKSIEKLFPSQYRQRAVHPSENDMQKLHSQERSYAAKYLEEIGRKATIGEYRDFTHTLLTDVGVSVEVSNITVAEKEFANYPIWIGNREVIEDGTRYVYEMSYNKEAHEIKFTKYEYETKKIKEMIRLDSLTGAKLE